MAKTTFVAEKNLVIDGKHFKAGEAVGTIETEISLERFRGGIGRALVPAEQYQAAQKKGQAEKASAPSGK